MKRIYLIILTMLVLIAIAGCSQQTEEITNQNQIVKSQYKIIEENLAVPWEIRWLPDGELLITERPGTLLRISDGQTYEIDGVSHIGEGGLLGMALHPEFENNHFIYLYLTSETNGEITNRVQRYKFENNELTQRTIILEGIPGAAYHDGGRMEFGPNNKLYITTGDATREELAQDTNSLAGKILRINDDGTIPTDNPFGNEVYSYGHRNPQGLTWDEEGMLWSTEHGRSGVLSGYDELNLIEKGQNYGWPEIQGDETKEGMQKPMLHSGPDTTWAPASAEYKDGKIYFGGLRGSTLYEYNIQTEKLTKNFEDEFGRIRTVKKGPGGNLFITTSNTDGRGNPEQNDDKIIKILTE